MEDFYPFTSEDLPKLFALVNEDLLELDSGGKRAEENAISLLLRLIIDLLDNVEMIRALKDDFLEKFDGKEKVSDGFKKIVSAYLDANNGTGNLLRIIKVLTKNGHQDYAKHLEPLLIRYSLPLSSGGIKNENMYSASRGFLIEDEEEGPKNSCVPLYNVNSVWDALRNSVILEEVFKKLPLEDQKTFRMVSPTWKEETLPFWRRNTTILIHVWEKLREENGVLLDCFINALEQNLILVGRVASKSSQGKDKDVNIDEKKRWLSLAVAGNHKLKDHPFHSYQLSYYCNLDHKTDGTTPFSCGQTEATFWKLCGPYIEDLQIDYAWFNDKVKEKRLFKVCETILDICPNLKMLKISDSCYTPFDACPEDSSGSDEEDEIKERKNQAKEYNLARKQRATAAAVNLHTLIIDVCIIRKENDQFLRKLLFRCPNLKTLYLDWIEQIDALLFRTIKEEYIKLDKLVITKSVHCTEGYLLLREYAEMLVKNKFDSLQHIQFGLSLPDVRSTPFDLYAALAQTSHSLKTLELNIFPSNGDDLSGERKWFTDLSPYSFPNLTKFKLVLDFTDLSYVGLYFNVKSDSFPLKFDFGTLKGMPMLEQLEVRLEKVKSKGSRSPGVQDWIFAGDRCKYLPTGITVDYFYSKEAPILCRKLKQFTFQGWSLNEEDIKLVSSWFPNLTHLKADVNPGTLSGLLGYWPQLKKLDIQTERLITLLELRPLKEKQKHLRVFQTISGNEEPIELELKEHKGVLYFSNLSSESECSE